MIFLFECVIIQVLFLLYLFDSFPLKICWFLMCKGCVEISIIKLINQLVSLFRFFSSFYS